MLTAPVRRFGTHSYEVYLTHEFLVILGVAAFLRWRGTRPRLWTLAIAAATAPLGWAVAPWFSEPMHRRCAQREGLTPSGLHFMKKQLGEYGKVVVMKLGWLLLLVVASSSLCQNSVLPAASEGLADALKRAAAPIAVTAAGELTDAGGELVTDAIEHARFVLIGESHFSRETPLFAAAVCQAMHPDSYAVEAGPSAASYVNRLLKSPDRKFQMQRRERAYPASMAFLNDEQENDLAAHCAAFTRNKDFALWGLDQEFLGAAPVLIERMKAQPNGPKAAAAIRVAAEENKQAQVKAWASGDFSQLYLGSSSDSEVMALQAAVDADGTLASRATVREFAASRRIYRLHVAGSQESNRERATLLKQHFLERYRALQRSTPHQRILLKFGDNHMWKGFNDTQQLDLGNFVTELASVEDTTSLHIQVLAAEGTLASLGGYGRPLKSESFVLADLPEYAWLKPVTELLPADGSAGLKGVVVDLRKLRFETVAVSSEWQRLIYGYDLLVVLPKFTPASFYQ